MKKEEARKLYENKFFYEVVRGLDGVNHKLIGPLDTIRYANKSALTDDTEYIQVVDGRPVQFFKKDEIAVLDFDIRLQTK